MEFGFLLFVSRRATGRVKRASPVPRPQSPRRCPTPPVAVRRRRSFVAENIQRRLVLQLMHKMAYEYSIQE
jgi:hypothetical protein